MGFLSASSPSDLRSDFGGYSKSPATADLSAGDQIGRVSEVRTAGELVMRSYLDFVNEFSRTSRAKGVHSLQVPRQTHQTPFAPGADYSAQEELPEFHDMLDQAGHRLDRALAQCVQLAIRVAFATDSAWPPTP